MARVRVRVIDLGGSHVKLLATGSADGRVDVYVAGPNGFGASNLTANLRGTVQLLGWVGGER